jgi:hypothetical protein
MRGDPGLVLRPLARAARLEHHSEYLKADVVAYEARASAYPSRRISTSAFCNQHCMSISRYIVVAVMRCSCA